MLYEVITSNSRSFFLSARRITSVTGTAGKISTRRRSGASLGTPNHFGRNPTDDHIYYQTPLHPDPFAFGHHDAGVSSHELGTRGFPDTGQGAEGRPGGADPNHRVV